MKSDWYVSPAALSRARKEQLLSQAQLATKSGASLRSIQGYERLERPVRLDTLTCIARVLSVGVKDIATLRTADGGKGATKGSARAGVNRGSAASAAKGAGPELPAPPSVLPARTPLETLVDLEHDAGIEPSVVETACGPAEVLTAKRLQDILTAYALHEGARFRVTGKVAAMRAIVPSEAALLGSRSGIAARFNIAQEVVPGQPVAVTIHSARKEHTAALQARYKKGIRAVVRVLLVPGEPEEKGPGFTPFAARVEPLRLWTFVVEEVTAAEEPAAAKKKTRG